MNTGAGEMAVGPLPELPITGRWLYLDAETGRYRPLTETYMVAAPLGPGDPNPRNGGLTDEQLRAGGVDPAEVVDTVVVRPEYTRDALNRRVAAADRALWSQTPAAHLDGLVGRTPAAFDLAAQAAAAYTGEPLPLLAPVVGLLRDHDQPWRAFPAVIADPAGPTAGESDQLRAAVSAIEAVKVPRGTFDPTALEVDARITGWTGPQQQEESAAGDTPDQL